MDRALTRQNEVRRALQVRVHGALFVTAVLFSLNYIVSKVAMREILPFAFAWLRVAGAAMLLSVLVPRGPLDRRLTRTEVGRCAAYAVLGVVVNQLMFLGGLARTTAHEAALLITTIPVFVLLAAAALGRERITRWKSGGVALACSGAVVIVLGGGSSHAAGTLTGNVMIIVNCVAYSLYLVLSRPLFQTVSATRALRAMFAFGCVFMLPFSVPALVGTDWSSVRGWVWVALLVVIAGPTVGAYVLNGWALARAESSTVAVYTYLQPVMASLMAAALLAERIGPVVLVGGLLILTGVALASRPSAVPIEPESA